MIGVSQDNLRIEVLQQFARRHRLHRSLRPHRHEHRRLDRTVGSVQQPGAGTGVRTCRLNLEVQSLLLQSRSALRRLLAFQDFSNVPLAVKNPDHLHRVIMDQKIQAKRPESDDRPRP